MNHIHVVKTESADGKRLYYMSIPGVGNIRISRRQAIMLRLEKDSQALNNERSYREI